MVDYLVDSPLAGPIADRIEDSEINVPAHFDAEVLSALGRLQRAGQLTDMEVEQRVSLTAQAPSSDTSLLRCSRELGRFLAMSAWSDALDIELADQLDATIVTNDSGMASATTSADRLELQQ